MPRGIENNITCRNILPNSPKRRSISNYILYRKLKNPLIEYNFHISISIRFLPFKIFDLYRLDQ